MKITLKGCFEIIEQSKWRQGNCIKPCMSLSFSNHFAGHFIAYSPFVSGLGYLMEPAVGVIREISIKDLIDYSSSHVYCNNELLSLSGKFTEILDRLIDKYAVESKGATKKRKTTKKKTGKSSKKKKSNKKEKR